MAVMAALPGVHARMSPEELYEAMEPIEGLRIELLGGRLVMTGSPSYRHGLIVLALVRGFWDAAQQQGWDLLQNVVLHVQATRDRLSPDLVVAPANPPMHDANEVLAHGVYLVAEVVSPGSASEDRLSKPRYYAEGRVPIYLLVDPETDTGHAVTLYADPDGTEYRTRTIVAAGAKLALPDPISMVLDTGSLGLT